MRLPLNMSINTPTADSVLPSPFENRCGPWEDGAYSGRTGSSLVLPKTDTWMDLTMPRKSTYFYPKVMSGLILNPIDPAEEIVVPARRE